MANSVGLSPEQLHEVTRFMQPKKQIQALVAMSIPFKVRLDGTPFVSLSSLESYADSRAPSKPPKLIFNE